MVSYYWDAPSQTGDEVISVTSKHGRSSGTSGSLRSAVSASGWEGCVDYSRSADREWNDDSWRDHDPWSRWVHDDHVDVGMDSQDGGSSSSTVSPIADARGETRRPFIRTAFQNGMDLVC